MLATKLGSLAKEIKYWFTQCHV